jgi:hypothetical protein
MNEPDNFVTERLPLAIFLHATGRLRFLGCEPNGEERVRFVFADPISNGTQAELEFDRGAEVSASALFASQKFLRRAMDTQKRGDTEHARSGRSVGRPAQYC